MSGQLGGVEEKAANLIEEKSQRATIKARTKCIYFGEHLIQISTIQGLSYKFPIKSQNSPTGYITSLNTWACRGCFSPKAEYQ